MWHTTSLLSYHMVSEWRQVFPLGGMLLAEGSQNHWWDPSRKSHCKAVSSSQSRDSSRQWPSIGYDKHWKWLGNEERGKGIHIAQNDQGPQCFGDVAGQPKRKCYTDAGLRSKQTDDSRKIHFRHGRDRQSILVTLSTWWCGCIEIVRKITFSTSFVCKEHPWRTNSNIKCPLNQKNQASSSRKWWG